MTNCLSVGRISLPKKRFPFVIEPNRKVAWSTIAVKAKRESKNRSFEPDCNRNREKKKKQGKERGSRPRANDDAQNSLHRR